MVTYNTPAWENRAHDIEPMVMSLSPKNNIIKDYGTTRKKLNESQSSYNNKGFDSLRKQIQSREARKTHQMGFLNVGFKNNYGKRPNASIGSEYQHSAILGIKNIKKSL